jgi:NADH:ubiquinone oxidoreductase subunit C
MFNGKKDIRNLMLEYSKNEYPMLKEFPCEGHFDVYYDLFEDQLQYVESEFVEL